MLGASPTLGRRVVVTGLAGAGKSTLSVALAAKTGLPLIHLDLHYWKPGWTDPTDAEWREQLSPEDPMAPRLLVFADSYRTRPRDLLYEIFVAELEYRQ